MGIPGVVAGLSKGYLMPLSVPSTQELYDQNIARFESALGQTAPINERAFLRVLAAIESLNDTGLYKLVVERALQNLALTATGEDLDLIGAEYETIRKPAASTVLVVTLPALTGTTIPQTAIFIGAANGLRYYPDTSVIAVAGIATLSLTCETTGVSGNLQLTDTLTIASPVAGAEQVATVTGLTTTGTDAETDAAYRPRVRFAMRAVNGGGNATDHKIWAEKVAGVLRAYPYAGKPVGGGTSYPGDRTVYIEADSSIDADGIPDAGLLASVRAAINNDPVTGASRSILGLIDATLYVEPIIRTTIDVVITNLTYLPGTEATVKAAISAAVTPYLRAMIPYVDGVDLIQDRNDLITDLSLSSVVQETISVYGASATDVSFSIASVAQTSYRLDQGETVKLGTLTYATV